jgi:hypothetical protein
MTPCRIASSRLRPTRALTPRYASRRAGRGFRMKFRSQATRARLLSLIRGNSVRASGGRPRKVITSP